MIETRKWPAVFTKKFPKYVEVPATLLGRLAIDKEFHRQGLGEYLLLDALFNAWEQSNVIASFAVVVDAIDEEAVQFYMAHGFTRFEQENGKMFIVMKTIEEIFS